MLLCPTDRECGGFGVAGDDGSPPGEPWVIVRDNGTSATITDVLV